MTSTFKKIYILLFICCTTHAVTAQTVIITGTTPVEIECEYKYTANISNVPNTWLNLDYERQVTFIGPNEKKCDMSQVMTVRVVQFLKLPRIMLLLQ